MAPWPEDPPLEEELYPELKPESDLSHPLLHQTVSQRIGLFLHSRSIFSSGKLKAHLDQLVLNLSACENWMWVSDLVVTLLLILCLGG